MGNICSSPVQPRRKPQVKRVDGSTSEGARKTNAIPSEAEPEKSPATSATAIASQSDTPQPTKDNQGLVTPADQWFNGFKLALTLFNGTLDSVPVPGLKAVVGSILLVIQTVEKTEENTKKFHKLETRIKDLQGVLKPQGPTSLKIPPQLAEQVEASIHSLAEIQPQVKAILDHDLAYRIINVDDHVDRLAELLQSVEDLVKSFVLRSAVETWTVAWNTLQNSEREVLNGLPRAKKARWDYAPNIDECMEGTRLAVLARIEEWMDHEHNQRVFWLRGLAGLGKSSIAKSVCLLATSRSRLGASFFCSRDDTTRKDIGLIFPTIAFQLCQTIDGFGAQLTEVLKLSVDISAATPAEQVKRLIIAPLQKVKHDKPIIIVVDALDECDGERSAFIILMALSELANAIPHLKVFITSRPEDDARRAFSTEALRKAASVQRLEYLGRDSVQADIRLFLERRLGEMAKQARENALDYESQDLSADWPNAALIDKLVARVDGFFIYAATLCKYALSGPFREVIEDVANLPEMGKELGSRKFNELYKLILTRALQTLGSRYAEQCCAIVGTIILLQAPLSLPDLGDLFGITVAQVARLLGGFHSVLSIPDQGQDDVVRAVHASFHDYLVDEACEPKAFAVSRPLRHGEIALLSLNHMEQLKDLKISPRQSPASSVTRGALDYSCRYWDDHLVRSFGCGDLQRRLIETLHEFLTTRLLDWVEYLVNIEHLEFAIESLLEVRQWWKRVVDSQPAIESSSHAEVGVLLKEIHRLLLEYFEPLNQDSRQLYTSALPFLQDDSLLRRVYASQTRSQFTFRFGQRPNRNRYLSSLTLPSTWPLRVTVSSDGKTIVCVVTDDARTELSFAAWEVQSGRYLGVVSHDGSRLWYMWCERQYLVTSWDDGYTRCWDLETMSLHYTATGFLVTLMPKGIPHIFDEGNGSLKDITSGLEVLRVDTKYQPTYFPEPINEFTTSIMPLWISDSELLELKFPEIETINCGTYSHDGNLLAVGTQTGTIQITDLLTGERVVELDDTRGKGEGWIMAVAFSRDPEATFVAGGGNLIGVWKTRTGECKCVMRGHAQRIDAISFMPDNSLLITASVDATIKIWDWKSADNIIRVDGHQLWITGVGFSLDGEWIASVSWDGGVCLWDANAGKKLVMRKARRGLELEGVEFVSATDLRYTCHRAHTWDEVTEERPSYDLDIHVSGSRISLVTVGESENEEDAGGEVTESDGESEQAEAEIEEAKEGANTAPLSEVEAESGGGLNGEDTAAQADQAVTKPADDGEQEQERADGNGEGEAEDEEEDEEDEEEDEEAEAEDKNAYQFRNGWVIFPGGESMFWIPERYRGNDAYAFFGNQLAVGGGDGLVALLELPPIPETPKVEVEKSETTI